MEQGRKVLADFFGTVYFLSLSKTSLFLPLFIIWTLGNHTYKNQITLTKKKKKDTSPKYYISEKRLRGVGGHMTHGHIIYSTRINEKVTDEIHIIKTLSLES